MCGRFAQAYTIQEFIRRFGVGVLDGVGARYNIAPTQEVLVLMHNTNTASGLAPQILRWGLVPHWAKDPSIGNRMINARGESAAEKPSFRTSFKSRRCIVPASGFFEWKKAVGTKQPYYIYLADGTPMAMAGLWAQWRDPDSGNALCTFTILTLAANNDLQDIHDRMPLILRPEEERAWVDPDTPLEEVHALVTPPEAGLLSRHTVATVVNSPANDQPACIEAI